MLLNTVPPVDCKCAAAAAGPSSRLALSERFVAVLSTPLVEQPSRESRTKVERVQSSETKYNRAFNLNALTSGERRVLELH